MTVQLVSRVVVASKSSGHTWHKYRNWSRLMKAKLLRSRHNMLILSMQVGGIVGSQARRISKKNNRQIKTIEMCGEDNVWDHLIQLKISPELRNTRSRGTRYKKRLKGYWAVLQILHIKIGSYTTLLLIPCTTWTEYSSSVLRWHSFHLGSLMGFIKRARLAKWNIPKTQCFHQGNSRLKYDTPNNFILDFKRL